MEHGDDGVDSEASEGDSLNTDEELLAASLGLVLGRFVRSAHNYSKKIIIQKYGTKRRVVNLKSLKRNTFF